MSIRIFIVEDDPSIYQSLADDLSHWGYDVSGVTNFEDVMSDFTTIDPALVVLDIQLPAYDGFHWCRKIREVSKVPILFLSSRDHPMDMVMAMQLGADDYVQKPFHLEVLRAKIQALLRRTYTYHEQEETSLLEWNGAIIDLKSGTVRKDERAIDLTKNEFFILAALVESVDEIMPRDLLIRKLWDDERFVNDNTLTVNVNRLRQKLADIALDEAIVTKKGLGYMAVTL